MNWIPSETKFANRFDKYLDPKFFQHRVRHNQSHSALAFSTIVFDFNILLQIHWFSIFNSFMMVIFLVGLVSMILMRTLRKDYARYSRDADLDDLVSNCVNDGCPLQSH